MGVPILTEYGIERGYKCDVCQNYYAPIHLFWNIRVREVTGAFYKKAWGGKKPLHESRVVCQFCTVRCDECGLFQALDEGHHSVDLDKHGFLTGEEIHLCTSCKRANDKVTPVAPPCLSNTPKTPAPGTE